ncbi:MAG: Rpn family recombination-promoting nuclease/putative transposase [Clostridiales bacterium]|nr:Rpn family recombination-promoting nuclease/putative transposase [Clostridiales bacterium]
MFDKTKKIYPRNDLVFKRIFGDNRNGNILKSFLKSTLKLSDDDLSKIEIIESSSKIDMAENKEKIDRRTILDIKCTTKSGKIIGIELQIAKDTTMKSRVIYSNAKTLVQQLNKKDLYSKLKEVITIIISIDHIIIEEYDDYKYCFNFYDEKHKIKLSDLVRIYFLEFQRIPEELREMKQDEDLINWLRFIGSKSEEEIEMLGTKNPELNEAVCVYKELTADEAFREEAWKCEEAIRRERSRIYDAKKEREIEIARNFLKLGLTLEQISQGTGLAIEEIKNLIG